MITELSRTLLMTKHADERSFIQDYPALSVLGALGAGGYAGNRLGRYIASADKDKAYARGLQRGADLKDWARQLGIMEARPSSLKAFRTIRTAAPFVLGALGGAASAHGLHKLIKLINKVRA